MTGRRYFVYILTNRSNRTLYIGMSGELRQRLLAHRQGFSQFTQRYSLRKLVYFEVHEDVQVARQRERTLKRWLRAWKTDLVKAHNPDWADLTDQIPLD